MPCQTHPPRAGVHCPTHRHSHSSLSSLSPRGSSRPQLTGLVSRRVRARGRRWPIRQPRRTSPVSRPAGAVDRTSPPSRPAPGRGLRTGPTRLPASRPDSDRDRTRTACSAARHPATRTALSGAPKRTRPARGDALRPARWVPTASLAGSRPAMRLLPTASHGHRRLVTCRRVPRYLVTSRRTACHGHPLPATRAGCLLATRLPRTAFPGVPRLVERPRPTACRAARCADRHLTRTARRLAGSRQATPCRPTASRARRRPVRCRRPTGSRVSRHPATHPRRTASRVPPRQEGRRTVRPPVHPAAFCRVKHRRRTAFRALPPLARGRKPRDAGPCPRTGT